MIEAKKRWKQGGWRREEKELEHNDLDTGTFFNTSDWPANKHILAMNTHIHTQKTHTFFIESLAGAKEVQKCPQSLKALDTFPTLSSFGTCPRLARSGPLLSNSWLSHCCELFVSALPPLRVSPLSLCVSSALFSASFSFLLSSFDSFVL